MQSWRLTTARQMSSTSALAKIAKNGVGNKPQGTLRK
jgi:hypothetical protein